MKQRWFALVSMCLALSWFWLFGAAGLPFATAQDPHLYTYDVLSGIQPGGASTMGTYEAADVILTQGWHYAGVNAIDIDSSPKGASVYAAIRAIDPNSQITATVSWSVNVNGCEYVSVTFARTTAASREILGEVHYLHTRASSDLYDGQSIALPTATNAVAVTQIGTLLDAPWAALKPKDPDELSQAIQAEIAARLTDTADPFAADGVGRVGNVQYVTVTGTEYAVRQMFGRLRSDGQLSGWYKQRWSDDEWPDDADGAGCASTGVHLHQAENLTEGNKLWRNADRASNLDDDGFGFPTGQLGARRFCSDTWVFRLQSSQTAPQASPVQPCGAPTAAPANLTAAAGNGRIALRWDDPNGETITRYELRRRLSDASSEDEKPWGEGWKPIPRSGAGTISHTLSEGLTNGTTYTLQVRAVGANGYGPAGTVSARPSASIPPATADPALKTLALSGASLAFDSTKTSYAVTVDDDLSRTTVTATPSNSRASLTITPSDATPNTDAHDVDLAVGVTTITVAVAHEGETRTYTVTVTRPNPLVAPVVSTFNVSGTTLTGTFTWAGSSPRFLRWTLYSAPSEDGAYSAVGSAVEDSQTPVVFSGQTSNRWYKLRGQACEHRTDVGARGASAGGRQAVQLVTVCGSWSAYSSAKEIEGSPPCSAAFGAEGASGESGAAADTTVVCTPGSPANLTVGSVTDSKAILRWNKATGADGYEVQIDGADVETTLGENATSYEFTLPSADTAYQLGVAAKRGDQLSAFATLTLLKPPSSITRSTTIHNSVKYTWADGNPTGSATGAEVKIGASGTRQTADSTTYHTFDNLSASEEYTFYIRLKNNQGPSAWRTATVTTPAQPAPPLPPTCAADESTKSSTTQTVTSTETRWASARVYEYLEQRTKSQAQVRSVTWNSSTCTWSEGAWRNSGSPSYSVWSATGAERCKEPYATKLPETKTETVTGQQWVLRGTTAYQQSRTGTEHYSRTVTKTGPRACGWTNPAWGSPDRTAWGGWTDTGTSKTRPADQTRTVSTLVNTEWRVVGATACQWRQHSDQPQTKRAKWVAPNWVFGGAADWRDSGSPSRRWSKSSTCKTRQADQTRTVSTLVKTEWRVGSSQACQWTQYSDQRQTKRAKWVAPNWVFGGNADWRDSGSPTLRWSRGSCWAKPAHDVVTVRLWGPWDRPRWVREESPIICFVHEEKRRSYKYAYYFRPHVWSGTAEAWVDGRRNPTPYFTEPDYSRWTDWARTGTFRLCPQRSSGAAGQSETAERKPAQLAAGDYKLQWGDSVIGFTVPAGATVEVRSRRLDSGKDAAVFSVAGGAELVVTPDMLAEDAATGLADTSDSTLAALSSSLALVQADAAQTPAATETACTEAAKPESGATPVNLAGETCVIVRGGGGVSVALGANTLTLTLPAARDWLVFAAPQSSADAESAFWFLDLTSGGRIVLSPSDGSELERHTPADATGLPALLDAIAASAAPSVYPAPDP